jgi:glycerol kinase
MDQNYTLAIDEGTTGCKVLVMDSKLKVVAEKSVPFDQIFPKPGWVEHDLEKIWTALESGIAAVTAEKDLASKIKAIGITNQRETICFWDKKSTKPLCNAIVWQDRRTSSRCEELRSRKLEEKIRDKTGLVIDPYFSSTKIEWTLKNVPAVKSAADAGTLAIGTIDSFLLARLTAGQVHATEPSNASRTMLYNIEKLEWDEELLRLFSVPKAALPEVKPSFSIFGLTKNVKGLPDGIQISGILGDQQSALLGQACVEEGQAKCTFGTGAFLLLNTGKKIRKSSHRMLSTIAWTTSNGEATYALEGSAFMAGATIQWLRDSLKMISKSDEVEPLAREVKSSDGVVFVPAFTGMGAPHWGAEARAAIFGMTRGTTRAHLARAALDGIAFQNVDILQAMEKDLGAPLKDLKVDGGACKNNLLMQIQADLLGRKLSRPQYVETTSLGAIFAAGLGSGTWDSFEQISKAWKLDAEFAPKISDDERKLELARWNRAVEATQKY